MLATLVIGLREGLEAALIVGIIAAFLRKNGRSLRAMWTGVAAAVALSIAVGVALRLIEQALPQAGQEGMESVIGAVAVVFVTGMIVWMNAHSRGLKKELEAEASEALHDGHAYALAVMAFLAVLKEGFETSVFLLATFSAATNATLAVLGAVVGVLAAVAIGVGLYAGSIRLNLSTFFRTTGAFLILVAAGLVITTLRTAHEAGWLNAGQQRVLDLGWLVAPGSVQAALITGVLGIPADPRLIEVVGWLAFLVPVALFVYWPTAHRARGARVAQVQFGIAGALAVAALALAVLVPQVAAPRTGALTLTSTDAQAGSGAASASSASVGSAELVGHTLRYTIDGTRHRVTLDASRVTSEVHDGVATEAWTLPVAAATTAPTTLTLDQLIALEGGRLPVGVNASQNPGPFHADWSTAGSLRVWTADGTLVDAEQTARTVVTISGGRLSTPRTLSISPARAASYAPAAWSVSPAAAQAAADAVGAAQAARAERSLWAGQLPIGLLVAALVLAAFGLRSRRRAARAELAARAAHAETTSPDPTTSPAPRATSQRSHSYAAQ